MASNLAKRVSKWLGQKRQKHFADLVIYSRGDATIADVLASQARIEVTAEGEDGNQTRRIIEIDWLIDAWRLSIDGERITPQPSDRIAFVTESGESKIYEVSDGSGEACWRWHDANQTTRRIKTIEVAA